MSLFQNKKLNFWGIISLVALIFAMIFAFDPPARHVASYSGILIEPVSRQRHSTSTATAQVRLKSGQLIVVQAVAELYGSPAGEQVKIEEYRSLIFQRSSYLAIPNVR
ncbi:hypothetical protein [Arenimonas sp. GDDSR-1]|uniref:hypothetical protein n=1 Tax=Arenimonas sp. GDDSR-1 TaxID=2950125 RepID=UPI0026144451|nr:hypothetical protein [Arenimonas sp. GDDSR-1]